MSLMRVTGRVVKIDARSGSKVNEATGETRPWSLSNIRVLFRDMDIVEVTRFADSRVPLPEVGEDVDWVANVDARGSRLNVSLDSAWASA